MRSCPDQCVISVAFVFVNEINGDRVGGGSNRHEQAKMRKSVRLHDVYIRHVVIIVIVIQ